MGDSVRTVDPDERPHPTERTGAKANRNALLMRMYERGFLGLDATMTDRDTALVDPSGIPDPRREVFDVYAEQSRVFKPTDSQKYPWLVEI